ncbi:sugar kinase [Plebeiibacterium sediminum]|uniref:Sugar kinase n=1 Tax=Plebeiibacterium sediminum TaxID=2992112 RepID=A0AAE3SG32_9BACT|nr:sugar kinase [Plebeiobacterium sediminum]MCW3787712.1 sugar kinase [Plebeiobacterium sediminum]
MQKVVVFGEVMLRLATEEHERFSQAEKLNVTYGGGETNVAISLNNFNIHTGLVTRLPDNDMGRACTNYIKQFGIDTKDIVYGGKRLGLYYLETGAVHRGSKVVYDREDSSFATLQRGMIDWETVFEGVDLFHWSGLSAALSADTTSVLEEAITVAHHKGITISCDINLRENLWNYGKTPNDVMPSLVSMCDIVFGNEYDAEHAMGIEVDDSIRGKFTNDSFIQSSQLVMKTYPKIKKIITTRRGNINASNNTLRGLVFDGSGLIETPTYSITHIVDRVGGGDAFTAGILYGLLMWPEDCNRILNFGIAASCLKHTVKGDSNQVTIEEVEEVMNKMQK